jgi:three-Cys-motif partner protein
MKATENFFSEKRAWSQLKDEILRSYLPPYLTKISHTRCPITIADCFAAKGIFDDGQHGSPLYIAKAIDEFKSQNAVAVEIDGVFIEKKYFNELRENLCSFKQCKLINNDYENWIKQFSSENRNKKRNLLLYVDPYGIKHLDFNHFKEICDLKLNSIEILLNFNSFGFLREGCRLMGVQDFESDDNNDFYEQDGANSIPRMNAIANGSYWRSILQEYFNGKITMKDAERSFCEQYVKELKSLFNYVVNIPIKAKKSHLPKYRLIFATNSEDGLLLVADKMSRTWKDFDERERGGQQLLFDEIDFPDENNIEFPEPKETIWNLLSTPHELKALYVKMIEIYGICYSESKLKKYFKEMEKDGELIVSRDPSKTPTEKVSSSWEYKKYKIVLRRGQSCQKTLL